MPKIRRRTVIVAGATAAAGTAIGLGSGTAHAAAPTGGASFVTIIAHSDDDLLFINPDIQPAILAGNPVRTIMLTADEFNGTSNLTREQLSAQLHDGQRNAYAFLAGVPSQWTKSKLAVAGTDLTVELNTLTGAPHVQLVYLNLPDGGDSRHEDALTKLWQGATYVTSTIIPTGCPVNFLQYYNQSDVHNVLLGLLRQFQPTVVRTQDPFPDDARFGGSLPEHLDHKAAAKFAQKAVKAYQGPTARPYALLTRYRCYNTQKAPANVPAALRDPKTAAYQKYKAKDPLTGGVFDSNLARNYERWPVAAPWVVMDGAGTLHAFVVAGGSLMLWTQPNGGAWTGPAKVLTGSFAPGASVARRGDGKIQVAVLDLDTGGVRTSNGTFTTWTSVGNPNGSTPAYGTPCLGLNAEGLLELYVVNRAGTLSNAYQIGSGFSGWATVSGGNGKAMTPPAAMIAPSGRLHVFADGNGKAYHWYQNPNGGTVYQALTTAAESTHTPGSCVDAANKVRVFTREQNDGAIGTLSENTPNGSWQITLTHIGGQGGTGPVVAVTSGGAAPRVLAFARNNNYGVSMTVQDVNGTFPVWQDLGGYCEIGPMAVRDAMGLVRVLIVGGDAKLYERRQTAPGPDAAFTDWQEAGA
ncbi:hypothetical protein Lesp02_12560 [Lentzea sp. NBRC 105346]|uniref:PIG-L family deacetylase n=1 Tax=Lentzea sp. NBRC 105346 TaxID=3032205 RepID=UPI0024A25E28|nr:PIG-L family deacetylase [Lentzea sp. NBRC 105346]GLZ29066.1 hypothetical protein Lesp02_12560 [Lentzea sp. NBRC 105346]